MRLHLRAETETEAAARERLQIPGDLRGHHRAAREGDRDVGAELHAPGVLARRSASGRNGIVARLGRRDAVEAERLGLACLAGHALERPRALPRPAY